MTNAFSRPFVLVIAIPTVLVSFVLITTMFSGVFVTAVAPSGGVAPVAGEVSAEWADLVSAEVDSTVSVEWSTVWQQAWQVNVGHVFEGDAAKVRSRVKGFEAIGNDPPTPNGGCFYRPASDFHSEAVVVRWLTQAFRPGKTVYNGAMFLFNMTDPSRSTVIPNTNGISSVPPDFQQIPIDDPRCSAAQAFYREVARAVAEIMGNGPWPGMPLVP
ncbi:MAG: hypothetical protein HYV90_05865 [Candidatus Woesebacteria bacterium]|nr:MAG: hypothetical protein HYV90_05865 [Candidatus Woesebacteria bacterium]